MSFALLVDCAKQLSSQSVSLDVTAGRGTSRAWRRVGLPEAGPTQLVQGSWVFVSDISALQLSAKTYILFQVVSKVIRQNPLSKQGHPSEECTHKVVRPVFIQSR